MRVLCSEWDLQFLLKMCVAAYFCWVDQMEMMSFIYSLLTLILLQTQYLTQTDHFASEDLNRLSGATGIHF